MQQYKAIKAKYPDAILLFRVGDYYEIFNEDAKTASEILGLQLKKGNRDGEVNHAVSFPHFSLDTHVRKLVKAGHKVAVCDQLEDPKKTTKNVKAGSYRSV
jgi:DNA mismatch repair protein MutS